MNVLIINAGSSSLKYQLMNPETGAVSAKIGRASCRERVCLYV